MILWEKKKERKAGEWKIIKNFKAENENRNCIVSWNFRFNYVISSDFWRLKKSTK